MSVPGLQVEPQHVIKDTGFWARVDLADEELHIVIEAESFEFHTGRKAFDRDCRRYNGLVLRGWLVVRFTWEQVMFEPELVAATLQALVDQRARRRARSTGSNRRNGAKTA
jgi:very-short-patch-repair endonuclease